MPEVDSVVLTRRLRYVVDTEQMRKEEARSKRTLGISLNY
jgi:hypothetical protein